jgi:hypothetical protein
MLRNSVPSSNRPILRRQQRILPCHTLLLLILTSLVSFYLGLLLGTSLVPPCLDHASTVTLKHRPSGALQSLTSLMSSGMLQAKDHYSTSIPFLLTSRVLVLSDIAHMRDT